MRVSVIVATRNRSNAVPACLDSIAAAIVAASPVDAEIIVVDNGSTDGTADVLAAWASAGNVPIQLLSEPEAGLSRARNRAMRSARGDLLVFTDDDCRLDPDYIAQLLAYDAADPGPVLRGGAVRLGDPGDLALTVTPATTGSWNLSRNSARRENIGSFILGCNMALRRSLAERIGPFDVNLGPGTILSAGEDNEYVFRAYLSGATIEAAPDMIVYHFHGRKTAAEGRSLMHGYMIGTGAMYAKFVFRHPNLCRQVYWDCKMAAREMMTGVNLFRPDIGFSARDKVACYLRGAIRYGFIVGTRAAGRANILPTPRLG